VQRLALFDLDDTLIDRRTAFAAWAAEFCHDHGFGPQEHALLLAADARHAGPRRPFFTTVRDLLAPAEAVDQLWEQYRGRMPHLVACRSEDLAALTRLRHAGWRLGVVTNGMVDNQSGKIRRTGLDTVVHKWAISDDVGVRKPDPRLFAHAARRCGCDVADGGWMTGDSLQLDVRGGRAAGLATIWLETSDRDADPPHADPAPDHRARCIPEAVAILLANG
jgi:HAD superfamily hydrolase (TIGR01549 family)